MTMDVRRRCVETSATFRTSPGAHSPRSESSSSPPATVVSTPPKPAVKRSFDVAFLMAPDDSSKKRHQEELKEHLRLVSTSSLLQRYSPPIVVNKPTFPEAPLGLLMPSKEPPTTPPHFTKSAFTKVTHQGQVIDPVSTSPLSSPPVTPELTYQDSLSPPTRPRSPPQQLYGKPMQYFPGSPPYLYPHHGSREKTPSASPDEVFHNNFMKTPEDKGSTSKRGYSTDVLPYGGLAMAAAAAYPFPGSFHGTGTQVPALLTAAANVTAALLPSSLAALTLPAQNVCAKCNISFRMTSDLVYHMRSQHKSDNFMADSSRRRREQDKLRCPVCNESFRERHHLTRHMTAHQDKDGDKVEPEEETGLRRRLHK